MAGLPEKRKKEKNPAVHFWELNFARTYGITAYDGENEMQIKKMKPVCGVILGSWELKCF